MKNATVSLLLSMTLSTYATASENISNVSFKDLAAKQEITTDENGNCRYDRIALAKIEDKEKNYLKDNYAGDWSCIQLKTQMAGDSLKDCSPDPSALLSMSLDSPLEINGTQTYKLGSIPVVELKLMGVKKPYRYELSKDEDGNLTVTVKIHFTGDIAANPANKEMIQKRLDKAADIWTSQSPEGKIKFKFTSVSASENPGFNVEIKPKTRGELYDKYWSLDMFKQDKGIATTAHEIGHMMGIPDEYDLARNVTWEIKSQIDTNRCNIRGLMCDHYRPKTYPYYYYLIMRRAACMDKNREPAQAKAVPKTISVFSRIGSFFSPTKTKEDLTDDSARDKYKEKEPDGTPVVIDPSTTVQK